jgi:hypothetical protein
MRRVPGIFLLGWTGTTVAAACGGTGPASFAEDGGTGGGADVSSGGSGSSSGVSLVGDGATAGEGGVYHDPTTCAEAQSSHSYIGCDYWPTITANNVWSVFDFAVVVANAGMAAADITVTGPASTNTKATVAPGQLTKIYLPWVSVLKGVDWDTCTAATPFSASVLARSAAYHLVSSVPVTVYQFNALEYVGQGGAAGKDWTSCPGAQTCDIFGGPAGCYSFSNDASLLLPTTAMTGNYRVTGHPGWGAAMLGSNTTITATANNTTVNVKVSSTGQIIAGGGIATTGPSGTLTVSMNAGDVLELVGDATDASDLSGSLVQATQPVQVITGVACLNVPDNGPACDHVEETNLPAETLGTDYVVVRPPAPSGSPVGRMVRIYGNFDGTHLTYAPSTPPGCPTTINAGQVVDCGTALGDACVDPTTGLIGAPCGAGNIVSSDFEVKGDKAFAIGTFTQGASLVDPAVQPPDQQGDPDQSMAVAVAQFRTKYVFLAPTDYQTSYATVIAPAAASISLDGQTVTAAATVVGSGGYGVMYIRLGPGQSGAHVLTASAPVGLEVTGYGSYTSYTYPGGLDLKQIAPPPLN